METDFQNASCSGGVQSVSEQNATFERQSRRLKYALNKASWLRISDWPHNQVSMSIEPSSIDACRGVAIFEYQPHT